MPFTAYYLNAKGELQKDLDEGMVEAAFHSQEGVLWLDISETVWEDGEFLRRVFGFHHLAVEDCVSKDMHSPKLDDFGDYLFMIVHGINYAGESDVVQTTEMALFLGPHFVVTNHNLPLWSVEVIHQQVRDDGRPMRRGAVFLAHALIDVLVDNILPTIDRMGEVTEEIEEEVVRRPQQTTLEAILKLKRSTLRLHRVMAPQREMLNRLSRGDFAMIGQDARIFFRDIYDHIIRVEDLNQSVREMADSALATYLSSVANRQNEVMKVLSVVATIFLPLMLLAGIYGMNFDNMPELHWSWGYFAVLGLMGVILSGIVMWYWGRWWFSWGRSRLARTRLFAVDPRKLSGYLGHLPRRSSRQ